MAYWVVVAGLVAGDWYRFGGQHIANRTAIAALILMGAWLLGVPLLWGLLLGIAGWVQAAIPMQWHRATSTAGLTAGAGIMAWALGLSLP